MTRHGPPHPPGDPIALSDPLRLLARPDKWYLGAGDGLLWAPPFPVWLDVPGFWDEALLFQYSIGPLFTVAFVSDGVPLPVRCRERQWTPAALTLDHDVGALKARESRSAPGKALVSGWELRNTSRRAITLDIVVWSTLDAGALAAPIRSAGGALEFGRRVTDRHGHHATVDTALTLTGAQSHAAYRSQTSSSAPRFELTPFWDRWQGSGRLQGELHAGPPEEGLAVFLGLQRRVRVPARGAIRFAAGIRLTLDTADRTAAPRTAVSAEQYFATLPSFRCSDPYLEHHWWHRWYGLRLNGLAAGSAPNYRHAGVCEGIGYFHVPITYSAPCHMRELRWHPDPEWARGVFRTIFDHQRSDGSLHGRVYADHLEGTDFYHADWGGAVLALEAGHPDATFRHDAYMALSRYADWLLRTRDPDGAGLIDVVNQYETGQEYMSRYQAVDPQADRVGWAGRFRLQGVDVTVYAYRLLQALEILAGDVAPDSAARWRSLAERTGRAVRERMWDPEGELFSDVDPASGQRTGVKAAVCFYPYATDLVDARHLAGMARHLFNPAEFWTPFPVPSSSCDDPRFDPDAEWNGTRHNCPWNGRVWPMTNSHVADALGRVVREHCPDWAPHLGRLLGQLARMMTFDGRADRPNCFEHYHPFSGRGSLYRGIDDYQHSWINDLLVTHVLGVMPQGAAGLTVHPLRLGLRSAQGSGLPVAGHRVDVKIAAERFDVAVDGKRAGRGKLGEPLRVSF